MKYYIDSKRYSKDEKIDYLKQGIFVNDLRGFDGSEENSSGFVATIEPSVLINHVGSILTKSNIFETEENIGVLDSKVIDYEDFRKNHKEVFMINNL